MLRINLPCSAYPKTSISTHKMCHVTCRAYGTDQHTLHQPHALVEYQLFAHPRILFVSLSVLWLGQTLVQIGGYYSWQVRPNALHHNISLYTEHYYGTYRAASTKFQCTKSVRKCTFAGTGPTIKMKKLLWLTPRHPEWHSFRVP